MAKVIGIGETVFDILFKNNVPVSAVPGGSVYNSIISLGRCGVNAEFISEVGDDRIGNIILDHLRDSGVGSHLPSSTKGTMPNTSFIKTIPTTVSRLSSPL